MKEAKKEKTAAAKQRNLTPMVSISDIAAELENDLRESVRKLAEARDVLARTIHVALMRTCSAQISQPGG